MNAKWLIVFLGIFLLVGVYYMLDPENKELDDGERKKLGGTYINLSDGITHYKLTGPIGGKVIVFVHGIVFQKPEVINTLMIDFLRR